MTVNEIDATMVTVGQPVEGGCCWVSFNTSNAVPTSATTAMNTLTGFESAGELSTNGFTEGKTVTSTDHKGWHGKTLLTSTEGETDTYKVELVEVTRGTAAKLRYGSTNVTVDASGEFTAVKDTMHNNDEVSLVFDELESGGWLRRTVVKRCRVTSMDEMPHTRGAILMYGMTFTALEPKDGSAAICIYRAAPVTE